MRQALAASFDEWRTMSRELLTADVAPDEVLFRDDARQQWFANDLFHSGPEEAAVASSSPTGRPNVVRVSPAFLELAREVACHRDTDRFNLLYRLLWRLTHGEPQLLEIAIDEDVHRVRRMQQAVARDVHKMHAFVRFRRMVEEGREHFVAWHRPDHRIVERAAPFFSRRFPTMNWTILTPDASVHWNGSELQFGAGAPASAAPSDDELEGLWKTYYRSTFNPARVNIKMMKREMPVRYWNALPETCELPQLLSAAPQRVESMIALQRAGVRSASTWMPDTFELPALAEASRSCKACDLCGPATQTVFGEGPSTARLMLVGEQPGDEEDRLGRPFVGPAGQVLEGALREAGIDRSQIYVTNVVKHFSFEERGKRRLHKRPAADEIMACRPWLLAELSLIKPAVLVCLGATAVQGVLRQRARLSELRGRVQASEFCTQTIATYHPSAVLRAGDAEQAEALRQALVEDLRKARALLVQG